MSEAETIQFLLVCLIGVVGAFGVGVCTLLWYLYQSVNALEKDHGRRITRLEAVAEFSGVRPG